MPFIKGIYGKQLDWAANYGLNERQIRVSVGLENTDVLIEEFKIALRAADLLKTKDKFMALT
jgi:cystathionine gamma-synthase